MQPTAQRSAVPDRSAGDGSAQGRTLGVRVLVGSPEALAAAVAGFSVGPMLLLLLNQFRPSLAIVLGIVGAVIAVRMCGLPAVAPSRLELVCHVVAVVVAICWFAYNARYTAQDVYATRDPAAYTITARWLVDHHTLQIPEHLQIFGSVPGTTAATGSFAEVAPGVLNVQGNHLLPALLALCGWLFGTGGIFTGNALFTTLALYVFFGLARRIVPAPFALVAMVALAVSMPLLYVGRDAFTEPLTLLFLMGALALLHRARSSGRLAEFAVAGLVGGASAMMRVDSYGGIIGIVLATILYTAVASERAAAVRRALALLAGAALTTLLGWLDLVRLSRQYYGSQHHNIVLLVTALVLTVLVGPVIVAVAWRPAVRRRLATARFRRGAGAMAVSLLVAVFAFLASRPLWEKTRGIRNLNLENMQARWHHPVDGTRTYHEQTVHWLALYLGWPTIVLAVVGYALLLVRLLRGRRYELAGVLAMGLPMSALYLWNGQVAPDQPWAMRRYVPEIMPLLLVAAVVTLAALTQSRRRVPRGLGRLASVAGCAFMIAFPLAVSWPMRGVRDEVPQLRQVHALCHALGTHAAVVEVDDPTIFGYGQTLRSFCGVPTAGLISATPAQLLAMKRATAAHGRTLYVLSQDITQPQYAPETGIAPPAVPPPGFSTVTVSRWPTEINVAPSEPDVQTYTVFLATVDDAGLAHPVRR